MPVTLYADGDEEMEGFTAVQGHFLDVNCMRVRLCKVDDITTILANFMVMRDVGDPDEGNNRDIMESTNASGVNLWYVVTETGFDLVSDIDVVTDLEDTLRTYEAHRKASLQ